MMSVLAVAGLIALAILSLDTLLAVFIASILALGLDPVVSALVRHGWKRGPAALFVFFGVGAAAVILVLLAIGPFWDDVVAFFKKLPEYWENFTSSEPFKAVTSTAGADDTVKNGLNDLSKGLPEAANTLLGIAGGIFGSFLQLVTLAFLSLFLMMERPAITSWMFGFATPGSEKRWSPVVEDSIQNVSSTLIGNICVSIIAGLVAGITAWMAGLPFPVVLGVITGLLDLIPQVGATVAGVILFVVGLTVSTSAAVAMAIVQIVYQQIENYVVYPVVYRRAVELTGLTTIVAVLIASALLGVVGAILAVPFAAVVKVVLREAGRPRRERMAALRAELAEAPVGPPPGVAEPVA